MKAYKFKYLKRRKKATFGSLNHIKTVSQGFWNQRTESAKSLWSLCKTKCDEITYATVKEVGIPHLFRCGRMSIYYC